MSLTEFTPRDVVERSGFLDQMPDVKLPKAPPTRVRRLTIWLFVLGFGVFGGLMAWATMAQITSAVVTSGAFRVQGDRLMVQHLEGGILRELNIQEGSVIEEGQVLAVIDGTRSKAQMGILRSQLFSALSQEARLETELAGNEKMELTDELAELADQDPRLLKLFDAQLKIFDANRKMMAGQVKILSERKLQLLEQTNGFDARRNAYNEQLVLLQKQISDMVTLQEKGLVTSTRMTSLRQNESAIMGNLGALDSSRQNILQRLAEVDERVLQLRRDRLNTVSQALLNTQESVFNLRERIDTVADVESREAIRAPRSGRVVGLQVNTIGGVVSPGQTILEIVPSEASFVVETQVKPTDIDEVILGGPAQVRLTAYNFRETLPVDGTVVHISADSMEDEQTGSPYFRVDVAVPPEALTVVDDLQSLPGMPAQVLIETGEQTLMDYMLNPIMVGLDTALKEGS
ncbi:MAG: HlyD family type I secretion periplasmic adaptor subunit [Pseudomonadota bacterium]